MVRGVKGRNFFAAPLVWAGMAVGAMPTALMVLTSLFRPVIRFWDLSPFLVERLFNALRPLMIFPLVEGVGFGYLVPQEVLLSVWVFYFALKLVALIGVGVFGWEIPTVMGITLMRPRLTPHPTYPLPFLTMSSTLPQNLLSPFPLFTLTQRQEKPLRVNSSTTKSQFVSLLRQRKRTLIPSLPPLPLS